MERSAAPLEPVGSLEKAIEILFHLHAAPEARGVTAIGRALGIPKSSALKSHLISQETARPPSSL